MPSCKVPNCTVAVDGKCIEGRGSNCPNLIPDVAQPPPAASDVTSQQPAAPEVVYERFPGITPLDLAEAQLFLRRGEAIVVALVGMPECGKTSLLARLHQLFQAGPIAGYEFAGSRSLPYFEELNWLATIESGMREVKMTRSSAQFDNSFLHVTVVCKLSGVRVELLFNDVTGETYEKAVASQAVCDSLAALPRADHLAVLIDGEALAARGTSDHHIAQAQDFIQRTLQSDKCGMRTTVHIVTTKLDKLSDSSATDEMERDFADLLKQSVGSVRFWRIAARPMDGSLPTVEQIGHLFASWVSETHRLSASPLPPPGRDESARDFTRYGL